MLQLLKLPDGTVKVLIEGHRPRPASPDFRETDIPSSSRPKSAGADGRAGGDDAQELEALCRDAVIAQFEQYIKLNKKIAPEVLVSINQIENFEQAGRYGRLATFR